MNLLAPFLATAPIMNDFRALLKKPCGRSVYWIEQLQEKFHRAQDAICRLAMDGLAYYDKTRPMVAITDWSREAIGLVILQQYCHCSSAIVRICCIGRLAVGFVRQPPSHPAKAGYASVEGETIAVVWCLQKAMLFLLGYPNLTIVTDHCPSPSSLGIEL